MEKQAKTIKTLTNINKPAYILLFLGGIIMIAMHNFGQAVIFIGLALVFDPFNTQIPFQQRPFYQQSWLIVHLSVAFALIVLEVATKF